MKATIKGIVIDGTVDEIRSIIRSYIGNDIRSGKVKTETKTKTRRKKYKRQTKYHRWSTGEVLKLTEYHRKGFTTREISRRMGLVRTKIYTKLKRLNLSV